MMPLNWTITSVLAVALMSAISGCEGPPGPAPPLASEDVGIKLVDGVDLIPLRTTGFPGEMGFCGIGPGSFTVRVQNQGGDTASNFSIRINYSPGGSDTQPVASLGPGALADVAFPGVPSRCFNPDCRFTIIVDSDGVVGEFNETNNTAGGLCIG